MVLRVHFVVFPSLYIFYSFFISSSCMGNDFCSKIFLAWVTVISSLPTLPCSSVYRIWMNCIFARYDVDLHTVQIRFCLSTIRKVWSPSLDCVTIGRLCHRPSITGLTDKNTNVNFCGSSFYLKLHNSDSNYINKLVVQRRSNFDLAQSARWFI